MNEPEWLRLLNNVFQDQANGAIKMQLIIKWGQDKTGPELLETVGVRMEAITTGLRDFGGISTAAFREALIAELRSAAPDCLPLLWPFAKVEGQYTSLLLRMISLSDVRWLFHTCEVCKVSFKR